MLYFFLFLLLVILAGIIVIENITTFFYAIDLGPFFENSSGAGIFSIIVSWTIGLPGKILGTVVGIVTFHFLDW